MKKKSNRNKSKQEEINLQINQNQEDLTNFHKNFIERINLLKKELEEKVIQSSKSVVIAKSENEKQIAQNEFEKENLELTYKQKNNELEDLEEKFQNIKNHPLEKYEIELKEMTEKNRELQKRIQMLEIEKFKLDEELLPYNDLNLLLNKVNQWDINRVSQLMALVNMHIMSKSMNSFGVQNQNMSNYNMNNNLSLNENNKELKSNQQQIPFNMNMFINTFPNQYNNTNN